MYPLPRSKPISFLLGKVSFRRNPHFTTSRDSGYMSKNFGIY